MKNKFNVNNNMPDPSCLYKWAWSSVRLREQTTNSCHRTEEDSIDIKDFQNFHNTPIKLKTRAAMLEGEWPGHGCEYCKKIEDVGGLSDRVYINNIDEIASITPPEILTNNQAIVITPTMVEVYFSNLCNMSCIYCSEEYSSVWETENTKYITDPNNKKIRNESRNRKNENYTVILKEFWKWLAANHNVLVDYNILGGEPFFQPELEQNIEFFIQHPSPKLHLKIFSNLKVDNTKFKRILDKIQSLLDNNQIATFVLTASLDCWGPEQEYVRTGLDLTQWEENFNILLNNYPEFNIQIHSTVCNLTINTLPELLTKIKYWNSIREKMYWFDTSNNQTNGALPILHTTNIVSGNDVLQLDIFPKGFFDSVFDSIATVSEQDSYSKNQLLSYKDSINNSIRYKPEFVNELKRYLDTIDSRRGLNWRAVFPWLDNFDPNLYNK